MSLSDELSKLDHVIEHTSRKLGNQVWSFLDTKPGKGEVFLTIQSASILEYVQNFEWDIAKYPVRLSVKDLADRFQQRVTGIEEEFRSRLTEYSNIAHSVAQYERSLSANLNVRDLTDVINIDDIIESDFLTTLFVVINKNQEKEWEAIYDTFDNAPEEDAKNPKPVQVEQSASSERRANIIKFVVPGSSKKIYQEGDQSVYSVTMLKLFKADFVRKVQKYKFTVRDVKIDLQNPVSGKENHQRMKSELSDQQGKLLMWCKTNFAEVFTIWTHLKALRVHVESILRFGLPPRNVAAIVELKKGANEKKIRTALESEFSDLQSEYIKDSKFDDMAFMGNEKFYPYVYLEMNLNYNRE